MPEEGIVDYRAVADAMVQQIATLGGEIRFSTEVTALRQIKRWGITTTSGDYEADFLINCGGPV